MHQVQQYFSKIIDKSLGIVLQKTYLKYLVHCSFSQVMEHILLIDLKEIVPQHKLFTLKEKFLAKSALNTSLLSLSSLQRKLTSYLNYQYGKGEKERRQ